MRCLSLLLNNCGEQPGSLKNIMKKYFKTLLASLLLVIIFLPTISTAQVTGTISGTSSPLLDKLKTVGTSAGYDAGTSENTILEIVGTGINVVLGLLGVIFIILMLLAGYNWMTAAGDQEKITKAQHTIREAIIGLIVIVGAFAIWMFISNILIGGGGSGLTPPG